MNPALMDMIVSESVASGLGLVRGIVRRNANDADTKLKATAYNPADLHGDSALQTQQYSFMLDVGATLTGLALNLWTRSYRIADPLMFIGTANLVERVGYLQVAPKLSGAAYSVPVGGARQAAWVAPQSTRGTTPPAMPPDRYQPQPAILAAGRGTPGGSLRSWDGRQLPNLFG